MKGIFATFFGGKDSMRVRIYYAIMNLVCFEQIPLAKNGSNFVFLPIYNFYLKAGVIMLVRPL